MCKTIWNINLIANIIVLLDKPFLKSYEVINACLDILVVEDCPFFCMILKFFFKLFSAITVYVLIHNNHAVGALAEMGSHVSHYIISASGQTGYLRFSLE